ncbi:MAG: arylsulfatase [Deltaproteobacteria bacterium]|nr:arylsulfatase [Deltaproteobacteria bacterium]
MIASDKNFRGTIKTHYVDSTPWWPEKKSFKDSPNILYILLDDAGYSDIGCYGSLIDTPNIDKLAEDGLRYRDFHVNAMCSPTRASLMSGCNHHSTGMGYLANYDLGFPGLRGCVDPKYGFISETLVESGYSTFILGKWHLINDSDCTGAGPFDHWPLSRGFNKFYGFLGACTSQFYPELVCGNEYVDQPKTPDEGYHLSEDITDRAIKYIGDLKSNDPDKPFFCHLAYGALHSPHHAPKEYIDRYKGAFDFGWDKYREKVFEKQKGIGLLPEHAVLTDKDRFIEYWDSYSEDEKKVLARYMEVYAGFMTHTDHQIGRLVDYLKKIGQYDNTMIVFMTDNGASAEGTPCGLKNTYYHFLTEKFPGPVSQDELEDLGSEYASSHYPIGWAHASNTPLKLYKTWTHNGGVKVPLIITYPDRIKDKGGIRTQYHHVVDIYRTVLDVCGLEEPEVIKGVKQAPRHGVSMAYTFDNPDKKSRKHVQYYEMLGNRGIWADGWKAVCDHVANPTFDFSLDEWELYHTETDFCEANNLAKSHPEKLKEMIDLWWQEAEKYGVFPMLESHMKKQEGFHSKAILKFPPQRQRTERIIYPEYSGGTGVRLPINPFKINVYAKYKTGDEGVLVSGGDNQGGFALYIQDNLLKAHNNWLSFEHTGTQSNTELPQGDLVLGFEYIAPKTGPARGVIMINNMPCGEFNLGEHGINSATLCVGKFPHVSITGHMREKLHYAYTNRIDRVELITRPLNDLDKTLELGKAAKIE